MSDKRPPLEQLPTRELNAQQAQEFAHSVVDDWKGEARPVWPRAAVLALAAAGLVLGLGLALWNTPPESPIGPSPSPIAYSPQTPTQADDRITASRGAIFEVSGERAQRMVTLSEGSVFCVVDERAPGEVFQVAVGEALVEVTGTRFGVMALDGDLASLWVEEGSVSLTLEGGKQLALLAGESWPLETPQATNEPRPQAPTPELPQLPTLPQEPVPEELPKTPEAGQSLRSGLELLDQGRFTQAAATLGLEPTDSPLREDALFWQAVALTRAEDLPQAREAFERFLSAAPNSPRSGAAHCMLSGLLTEDPDAADHHLQAARKSKDPSAARCVAH
jgi:ferric-dicitrate binding protein FerR (iron transport regulator)